MNAGACGGSVMVRDPYILTKLGFDHDDVCQIVLTCQSTRWYADVILDLFLDLVKAGEPPLDVLAAAALVRSGQWQPEYLWLEHYGLLKNTLRFAQVRLVIAIQIFIRAVMRSIAFGGRHG